MQPASVWEPPDGKGAVPSALRWTAEQLSRNTPSRRDGVSEDDERGVRFETCEYARHTVRELLRGSANTEIAEGGDIHNRVQMLACFYVQLFYQFTSVLQEDAKVVGLSAALAACKMGDIPRKMRDLLRTHNLLKTRAGEVELGEEEIKALEKRIVKTEFVILRIVVFHVDIGLPSNHLDDIMDRLLSGLTTNNLWRDLAAKEGKNPMTYALDWKPCLLTVAKAFLADQFTGITPLLCPTALCAAAAATMAMRYKIRQFPKEHIFDVVLKDPQVIKEASRRGDDARALLDRAIQETLHIFKVKTGTARPKPVQRTLPRASSSASAARPEEAARQPPLSVANGNQVAVRTGGNAQPTAVSQLGSAASTAHRVVANSNHLSGSQAREGQHSKDLKDVEGTAAADSNLDTNMLRDPGTSSTTAATIDPNSSAKSVSDDNSAADPTALLAPSARSSPQRYQPY